MGYSYDFQPLELNDLRREAAYMKAEQWRFVQMLAANNDIEGVDLYYSFMKDGLLRNYRIEAVSKATEVPSITDMFLAAFVFENEARELFGVNMGPIAIDFAGAMYNPAEDEPMTFISPEQKAAVDKLKKASAAAAAKAEATKDNRIDGIVEVGSSPDGEKPQFKGLRADQIAKIKEVMPTLKPEYAAKLQAVLDAAVKDEEQNTAEKAEGLTPNAVVGDAPVVESKHEVVADKETEATEPIADRESDEDLDKLLSLMDEKRASIVLEALKNGRA